MSPTRLLTGLSSMALVVLGLVALLPDCASACLCVAPPRAERALDQSSAVFAGKVVDFENTPNRTMMEGTMLTLIGGNAATATATLRVSEVWKGSMRETVQFATTPNDGVACAIPFEEGQKYLVYANEGQRGLTVDGCSATKPLSEAGGDLAVLGNGKEPEEGGDLTDTSGGFPPLGVIGMLGGALAVVSLAVLMRLVRTG
jgi:hypothetical protein